MARNSSIGKLSKLKCMIKRWNSSSRLIERTTSAGGPNHEATGACLSSASFHGDEVPAGYQPVYVGKSRRRYLVSSGVVDHPLFQNLLERSGSGGEPPAVIGCEVVLFEHLLWMLENADSTPESLNELVDFYSC